MRFWQAPLLALACAAAGATDAAAQLRAEPFVSGLTNPLALVQDPSDPAIQYVVQQGGVIRAIRNGSLLATPFLDLSGAISAGGERGLLGMAMAPDYATSGRVFLDFTNPAGDTVVARFTRSSVNPLVADPASRFDLLWSTGERVIRQPFANHNGGMLAFGSDGYLYIGMGDGGSGDDPLNNAQNMSSLLGKILRIDVSVASADSAGFVVPPDNPFPTSAAPEIWDIGMRNPWRFSFDDPARGGTGALVIGDVGQGQWEEVDYEPAVSGGHNYGWPIREGAHDHKTMPPPAFLPLVDPIFEYQHPTGNSITGGYVYRGARLGASMRGRYFFADFVAAKIWSIALTIDPSTGLATASDLREHTSELSPGNVSSFGVDAAGELYFCNWNAGTVARIGTTVPHTPGDYTGDGAADAAVFRPSSGQSYVNGMSPVSSGLAGDIPVVGDFNGDGRADIAVWRPSDGTWYISGMAPIQYGVTSDIPVPGDYNGDGVTDAAVFRTVDGLAATWYIRGVGTFPVGRRGDIPMPADYDGDGKDDVAVFRPSEGTWYIRNSFTGTVTTIQWGQPGDIPVAGRFDGDARADLAVYRQANGVGTWYLSLTGGGAPTYVWGLTGDVPMARDVTGDGVAELVVWRPGDGTWYSFNRIAGTSSSVQFGAAGDIPVQARPRLPFAPGSDFDGDGRSDITVYRPSDQTWYTKTSDSGYQTNLSQQWGINGDIRVPGDYDGDHKTDYAVFRPSNGTWYIRRSSTGLLLQRQFGRSGDVPMAADYDGDGTTDIAVFRPDGAIWYILTSSSQFTQFTQLQWGVSTDTPIAGDFDGDGRADVTVFRPSDQTWDIHPSSATFGSIIQWQWGATGDVPAPADFDGDGRTDLNVFRPSNQTWYVGDALLGTSTGPSLGTQWGISGDSPVPHDYDGDNKADVTVFRPAQGQWWIWSSSSGAVWFFSWGLPADGPVVRKSDQ